MNLSLLSIFLYFCGVLASSGDRLHAFQTCVANCISDTCPRELDTHLKVLLWTCESDCDYSCQQRLTDIHQVALDQVHQYHGKWPFRRLMGIQEPASVIFSLMNFWPNYNGFYLLKRTHDRPDWYMRSYYLFFAIVGMNAWIWSAVFHTRDFVLTERLDYFSAIASIMYGLTLALVRLFRLDMPNRQVLRYGVIGSILIFYIFHISYLSFIHFDYGYNMAVGVGVGMLQNILWVVLGVKLYRQSQSRIDLLPAIIVVAIMMGMSFELFDFAPFARAVDAHSLWHAATVIPTYYWYRWMLHDMQETKKHKNH